jgi:subtilisin family serine protease
MPRTAARLIGWILVTLIAISAVWSPSAGAVAFPNDPQYGRQWFLRRIGVQEAWKTTKGKGATIAIVDTGIDYRHPDLRKNILLKKQYDSLNDDFDAVDLQGHGTSVAGVAAAVTNNKTGIAGVAPEAKLMAVRAFGALDGARSADVADSIRWAADNGANVINLSLGGGFVPAPEAIEAVTYAVAKGVLVVAAAGNGAEDGIGDPYCSAPAIIPLIVCVGATDSLDRPTSFTNYGLRLDVVAPGQGIYTTASPFGYGSVNGTSVASPVVAGVGALLMSMGANNVLAGVILRATSRDLGLPGYDLTYGFGRVDAKAAVDLCKQIC